MNLYDKLDSIIPQLREERAEMLANHGDKKISDVTVKQAYGGMRGVKGLVCDTSLVEPEKGLSIRGIPVLELSKKMPAEIFYLLCTGELPTSDAFQSLLGDLAHRSTVPDAVFNTLRGMPQDAHPMAMLSTGIMVMENESKFRSDYERGMNKKDYWKPMLEDSLRLLACLPGIAAAVYKIRFEKGSIGAYDKSLDWGGNYAGLLGLEDPKGEFANLIRLYLVLHSDHEGGNVSANACHTIGSALSDAYYSVSGGLNGLAGPLHGLANQECLKFVIKINEKFGGSPTAKQITEYSWELLNAGQVIPGYGHAVLRVEDPRFTAFYQFGEEFCSEDDEFKTVKTMRNTVPGILKEHGKAASVFPNVDAGSGALLHHYGMKEFSYYTVLFSVSRAMGMLSQLLINRALGTPITRPKSVSTTWLKNAVK